MDIRTARDTEIRAEGPEVYEPPMLDEVGGFTALTRMDPDGGDPDRFAYFPLWRVMHFPRCSPDRDQPWFVALPDCDATLSVAAALGPHARQTLLHPPDGRG